MQNAVVTDREWNIVVAIPVKNEVEHISACLACLEAQRDETGGPSPSFDILIFVNNSDDGTADVMAGLTPTPGIRRTVMIATLPPEDANAGGARRHAMEVAARLLEQRGGPGLLLTTDADSCVPPDWIINTIAAINAGADAVAGTLMLDPDDEAALPTSLKVRGALEQRYEALVCELETWLDPQPHDPWPRHATESGASFALTLESFRAVGGVPNKALGEDRALAAALKGKGFRVRHDPRVKVVTSGRLFGRAAGGCADTMRHRIDEPTVQCDDYLRPALDVVRQRGNKHRASEMPLRSRALSPDDLPSQIVMAEVILAGLKAAKMLHVNATRFLRGVITSLNMLRRLLGSAEAMAPDSEAKPAARS